jgi:predicted ferric reductase
MTPPPANTPRPGLSPGILIAGYAAICLAPLALAYGQGLPLRSLFRELSGGLVMVGYAMMLVQFVLSGRFEQVSGQIGIDRTMRFHQVAAWAVLGLILVHPLLYAAPRLYPDPLEAVATLNRMFASPSLRTGVIAWWLTVLVVLMAVFRDRLPFRYEIWRLSHGLGALAIALLGTHHTLRVGTYSAHGVLAGFWIAATAIAVGSLLFVYLVKPFLKMRAPYRVVLNHKVADRTWELAIEPDQGPVIDFAAGQFVWLNLGHAPYSLTEHPFSISSAPGARPRITFAIKESGDFTNLIGQVAIGTRAYLDGPHGNFSLAGRQATGLVFIAGGVGFAPVMGMLRDLKARRYPHPIRLVYGNRLVSQVLYLDEIEALADALDFKAELLLSEPPDGWPGPTGEPTPDFIRDYIARLGPGDWLYFVCGPVPMMNSVEAALRTNGVPRNRIVSERFKYE